jgi:hypothetical protein
VEALQARDVIVYVSLQPSSGNRIGSVKWITKAGGLRYLQAYVSVTPSPDALIAAMGHELEHALEVAETSSVADAASFEAFYRTTGERAHPTQGIWETQRAYESGGRIGRELATSVRLAGKKVGLTDAIGWLEIYRCNQPGWSSQR